MTLDVHSVTLPWSSPSVFPEMSAPQTPLTEVEIDSFVKILDANRDRMISKAEIEAILSSVRSHLLIAESTRVRRSSIKSLEDPSTFDVKHFVETLLPTSQGDQKDFVTVAAFKQAVRSWNIPSYEQEKRQTDTESLAKVPLLRQFRAWWSVLGPEVVFSCMVIGLQIGLGVWQCLEFALNKVDQDAFGWGVAMAKFAAGSLYGTMAFLLLSMSRWWSTALRRFYYVSRFINFDHAQSFHIVMACEALVLSTVHAIGHLSGTFVFASSASRQAAVEEALHGRGSRRYDYYVRTIAGASGLAAICLFYIVALLSMPVVRRRCYEVFQAGHLLMYPFIGLLMCHGSAKLLQFPMLGLIIALPTALIVVERTTRFVRGFRHIDAELRIVDDDTVSVSCDIPKRRLWPYKAGQYVFLQVPRLSYFQWHPFTVSIGHGRSMRLMIKTDGNWTGRLRELAQEHGGVTNIRVGLEGPFGAPAERFYNYDQAIVVGAGIGITPFSAILNDLKAREDHRWNAGSIHYNSRWGRSQHSLFSGESPSWKSLIPLTLTSDSKQSLSKSRPRTADTESPKIFSTLPRTLNDTARRPPLRRPHTADSQPSEKLVLPSHATKTGTSVSRPRPHTAESRSSRIFALSSHVKDGRMRASVVRRPHTAESRLSMTLVSATQTSDVVVPISGGHLRGIDERLLSLASPTPSYQGDDSRAASVSGFRTYCDDSISSDHHRVDSQELILPSHLTVDLESYRRVDLHWIVRDKNHLAWFSNLLNDVVVGKGHVRGHLDVRIHSHVTQKEKDITLHVFRWLLERYRGEGSYEKSPLTGLYAPTHFGRPDFHFIMQQHYEDIKDLFERHPERKRTVGVFFCGAPAIGAQLADLCSQLTIKGVQEKTGIQYHFRTEVFN